MAAGTIRLSASIAITKAPFLKSPSSPDGLRVPSGKMMKALPALSDATARAMAERASAASRRSTSMKPA